MRSAIGGQGKLSSNSPEKASDMSTREVAECFARELQVAVPSVKTDIQAFPSGAVWLDIHYLVLLYRVQPSRKVFRSNALGFLNVT
jgi:hypothetical protein